MEKCLKKNLLYNNDTKRCYKSCEKKNKVTHPITKKCRQKCKMEKIRRVKDFRCVNPRLSKKTRKPAAAAAAETARATSTSTAKKTKKSKNPQKNTKEDLVQLPLQQEIKKNFKFLDKWIQKGEGKTVNYKATTSITDIMVVYFHEKYKQHCPMYPIKTYSSFDQTYEKLYYEKYQKEYTKEEYKNIIIKAIDWDKAKFLKDLKLCLETGEQLIMVPLRVPSHANMLIIKVPTREIIRFEPHGPYKENDEKVEKETTAFLEKLTTDINTYLNLAANRKFTYVEPGKICPPKNNALGEHYYGFQAREGLRDLGPTEGEGFCILWSWFFAECVILNPKMDVKEVYKEAFNELLTNESNFATIIRGYFYSINDELKKMKKNYTIEDKDESMEFIDYNRIILDYLKQNQVSLKNKARKTFQGGSSKKTKFIIPKANPKAMPVKL